MRYLLIYLLLSPFPSLANSYNSNEYIQEGKIDNKTKEEKSTVQKIFNLYVKLCYFVMVIVCCKYYIDYRRFVKDMEEMQKWGENGFGQLFQSATSVVVKLQKRQGKDLEEEVFNLALASVLAPISVPFFMYEGGFPQF